MRSAILGFRRAVTVVPQTTFIPSRLPRIIPTRTYKVHKDECDAHMNELPIPCGPWAPWYKAKQAFYDKIFIGGVLWFVFSFFMMILTDSIYLNFGPPERPGPPSDLQKDECEEE